MPFHGKTAGESVETLLLCFYYSSALLCSSSSSSPSFRFLFIFPPTEWVICIPSSAIMHFLLPFFVPLLYFRCWREDKHAHTQTQHKIRVKCEEHETKCFVHTGMLIWLQGLGNKTDLPWKLHAIKLLSFSTRSGVYVTICKYSANEVTVNLEGRENFVILIITAALDKLFLLWVSSCLRIPGQAALTPR